MEGAGIGSGSHWCHLCHQLVTPLLLEVEAVELDIKCPICQSGFVEEMSSSGDIDSDNSLSLWAPILLGMVASPRNRRRRRQRRNLGFDEPHGGGEEGDAADFNRRSPAAILQMLQSVRDGLDHTRNDSEYHNREERRERVVLINPFNQTIIISNNSNQSDEPISIESLGDYFIGPGLELLMQHLAENDPNSYGTPPAHKDAVEAMPTVRIEEIGQCSVCLDDLEVGCEAREMPCKHKFHNECILPWLQLHSSCPVCRYQLPVHDDSKQDASSTSSTRTRRSHNNNEIDGDGNVDSTSTGDDSSVHGHVHSEGNENTTVDEEGHGSEVHGEGNENRTRFTIPWPFTAFFSSSTSASGSE